LASLAVSALLSTAACAGSAVSSARHSRPTTQAGSASGTLKTYNGYVFRFRYPSLWTARDYNIASCFSASLVDVSNQAMHFPCTSTTTGTGTSTETSSRCSWPVAHLGSDGIWLEWSDEGTPGLHVSRSLGVPVTIGGRPSRQVISRPGVCGRIGGTETISVQIPHDNDNIYTITACLRGPDLSRAARQVQAFLNSVSFASS
jgi:hypothetical protein